MKTTTRNAVIVFMVVLFFAAFTAWLSGYNFDHRSADVAAGFVFSSVTALAIAAIAWASTKEQEQ